MATTQPLSGWLDIDVVGQKAEGGIVARSIVCNEVPDLSTDVILPEYRGKRVLEFLCTVCCAAGRKVDAGDCRNARLRVEICPTYAPDC